MAFTVEHKDKKEKKKKKRGDGEKTVERPGRQVRNADGSDDLAVTRLIGTERPMGGGVPGPSEPAKRKQDIPGGH